MFSLYYKQDDTFTFDAFKGRTFKANASFDTILKVIDVLNDKRLSEGKKLEIVLKLFYGVDTAFLDVDVELAYLIFKTTYEAYIEPKTTKEQLTDLAGNPLPEYQEDVKRNYSLKHDAKYIYASFMQAYGMDLLEQQGKLHWFKFQALLEGLPEETIFKQIIQIRTWKKPDKNETEEKRMKALQKMYKLPDE